MCCNIPGAGFVVELSHGRQTTAPCSLNRMFEALLRVAKREGASVEGGSRQLIGPRADPWRVVFDLV